MLTSRRLLLAFVLALAFVGVIFGAWHIYEWYADQRMLTLLLHVEDSTLDINPQTQRRLTRVIPTLIDMHSKGVSMYTKQMYKNKVIIPESFNLRIESWFALLRATEISHDPIGIAYIQRFISSDEAIDEEKRSGARELKALLLEGKDDTKEERRNDDIFSPESPVR